MSEHHLNSLHDVKLVLVLKYLEQFQNVDSRMQRP